MKGQPFPTRMRYAAAGLAEAWRGEASFRVQAVLGSAALLVTAALRPGAAWAALVALSVALVLALETANSALEAVIDHLHPDPADPIRRAKDMAAGAVLVASAGAAVTGVLMVGAVALGW